MKYTELERPSCFLAQISDINKAYPKSAATLESQLASILSNPESGARIPNFGEYHLRKARINLPEYNISKARGGRVIYIRLDESKQLFMISVYLKKHYIVEDRAMKMVAKNFKSALLELKERGYPASP